MKVKSDGKLEITIDEERIRKISNGNPWNFEVLKQLTKTATLMEVSCDDHRELRRMISENKTLLVRIAVVLGILASSVLGYSVVV